MANLKKRQIAVPCMRAKYIIDSLTNIGLACNPDAGDESVGYQLWMLLDELEQLLFKLYGLDIYNEKKYQDFLGQLDKLDGTPAQQGSQLVKFLNDMCEE